MEVIVAIASVLFFLGMWFGIVWLTAYMSGWRRLAERFAHLGEYHDEIRHGQSARIRVANYNGILDMGFGYQGFYLRPMLFFRPFHDPLVIPWQELKAEKARRFFVQWYRLTIRSMDGIEIQVPEKVFREMEQRLVEHGGYMPAYEGGS